MDGVPPHGEPAERTHLIEYGILAALIHQSLLERVRHGRHVPGPAALAVAVTALLGLFDEGIQAAIPSRVFDWFDVLFNALAGFMVIAARLALGPVRLPGWRLWFLWLMAASIGWGWSMDAGSFGEPRQLELGSMPPLIIPRYQGVAAGAAVTGVLHWLVLRRHVIGAIRWVPASLGAAALGALAVLGVGQLDPDLGLALGVGLYGTLAGVLHMLVLRQQVSGAGWWVLASTVGWTASIPWAAVAGPPGWAVYGVATGTVLVWLLRRRRLAQGLEPSWLTR